MARPTLTGSRIRQRRTALGKKQADLAKSVGISPSYLNLIEHNRRPIGGGLLNSIARELRVETSVLAEGAAASLLETLREAADGHAPATEEAARMEEFVGRFPGWAALLADMARRSRSLEHTVETLLDRMTHDPFLSESLHDVLSTVTAIRSTAAILVETPDLDTEWLGRFHRNLNDDGERLAKSAEALVRYLDEGSSADVTGATPQDEFDAFLQANDFHFSDLERALPPDPSAMVRSFQHLSSAASQTLAEAHLKRYLLDVDHMPLQSFAEAAKQTGYDPAALAGQFGIDLPAVFRRLATVPKALLGGEIGLVICDGSGTLTFRKPITGFSLPRFGAACPLWPLYQALTRPMAPVRLIVEMAERAPRRFLTYAICQPSQPGGFDGPQVLKAAMLILPADILPDPKVLEREPDTMIGTSCRICPRAECAARREPSILADAF
ncbi:helix-turn-helix transcriptional regulator [Actibacterium sp. 188UL27-1]|uniref:helix-turn-helix transcriptional regulator n=1 Tax=Actibacterium sp. 188UL27-1 TaxID=2786961 RepID=UPI00195E3B48|nr:helix-turn-helix transcriptional regulator [Actibacterium sp. 188UL27-1]MBM7068331.1 DUF2083 domain-containing protein [Actibacterium sp. 188UL27-1]